MNYPLLIRLFLCIFVFGACLYSYLNKQNELTELRFRIPHLAKEVQTMREENMRLRYEIEQFENPQHLLKLARQSEFSHLKYPMEKEVVTLNDTVPFYEEEAVEEISPPVQAKLPIALGAKAS